jgi:hypothetical protein
MINPYADRDTRSRRSFIPEVLDGGVSLDINRLAQTMAMLEDYVDSMLAMDDPRPGSPWIEEESIQL